MLGREVYFPLAGYAGTGFHTWPPSHIPQDNGSASASSQPAPCQKDVRRGVRRRHCSRVRWPRFPQLAFGPHPSRPRLRIRFFASGHMLKRRSAPRPAPTSAAQPRARQPPDSAQPLTRHGYVAGDLRGQGFERRKSLLRTQALDPFDLQFQSVDVSGEIEKMHL